MAKETSIHTEEHDDGTVTLFVGFRDDVLKELLRVVNENEQKESE